MSEELGRILLVAGLLIAGVGLVVLLAGRLGIGRLPGDVVWEGENWTLYIPIGWMVVLSILLTIVLSIFGGRR